MKRSLALLLFLCVLLSALTLSVFAHPGRTDANGGHWNHSTGEYHYHGEPDDPGRKNPTGNTTNQYWDDPVESDDASASSDSADESYTVTYIILGAIVLFVLWKLIISPLVDCIKNDNAQKKKDLRSPPPPSQIEQQHPISPPPRASGSKNDQPSVSRSVPPLPHSAPTQTPRTTPHPKPTPRVSRPISQATPPPTPTPPSLPFASGIIAEHPVILGADPDYLTEAQVLAYALSIETPRGKKAVTEQFLFDGIDTDKSTKPFRVTCSATSLNSYQQYRTTLISCTCKDHQTRHLPCKHMIALAINVNAITANTETLKTKSK